MSEIDIALLFKVLGDVNRLNIIKNLSKGERCGCDLLKDFNITQPTLSHHMKVLVECGIVNARKEGKWSYYSLCGETLCKLKEFILYLESSFIGDNHGDN